MRILGVALLLLATGGLLNSCGGGGGGGGGGATLADLGGTWLGPAGNADPAGGISGTAIGGMTVDDVGAMVGTGAFSSATGTFVLADGAARIFTWTGAGGGAGLSGMVMLSRDKNHLLFIATDGTFGAFERNAPGLAGPYADTDFRDSTWSGVAAGMDAGGSPLEIQPVLATVDAAGVFMADTSMSNTVPLAVSDPAAGVIQGDYIDPGPPAETGNLLVLITPDRRFMAVHSCETGSAGILDCGWAALER